MMQKFCFVLMVTVLGVFPAALPACAQDISEEEVLDLPRMHVLDEEDGEAAGLAPEDDLLTFTEEAGGEVTFISEEGAEEAATGGEKGPRILPQNVEKSIGEGLRGIEELTEPLVKPRRLSSEEDETNVEFDPASGKVLKIEF
ncbi:MAG: hypothetical protein HYY14_02700 [Candidatus Omnitrophica bacterium]|nr:hypothetical protein [Candidatus Omnitrophota bacterium]